jgi:3-dehydroquinate synthase
VILKEKISKAEEMPDLKNVSEIYFDEDGFKQLFTFLEKKYSHSKIILIGDTNTKEFCVPVFTENIPILKNASVLEIIPGEAHKSLETCDQLWQQLLKLKADRKSVIINLGGGVVCDVGGFIASTFMRGIDFIHVPTTLLAMADAAAGGKNGINFSGIKNLIGTFKSPEAVLISSVFLKTLPERHIRSGFAEVIKHTLIADREKWNGLKKIQSFTNVNWIPCIHDSIAIKNKIVQTDFRDENNRRTLNFGHTIGHALESYSLKHHLDPMLHGEAVAAGMVVELFISKKMLNFPENSLNEICKFIQYHFADVGVRNFDIHELIDFIQSDKKNEHSEFNFVLLRDIAKPVINQHPDISVIREAIDKSFSLLKQPVPVA